MEMGSYARALYRVSLESSSTELWLQQLGELSAAFANPKIKAFLVDPSVAKKKKSALLQSWLTKFKFDKELLRFIDYLIINNKILQLPDIIKLMQVKHDSYVGIKRVTVIQARAMSEVYKSKVAKWLQDKFIGEVIISWQIDSHLIGGLLVKDGDTIYDYSLRAKLNRLKSLF